MARADGDAIANQLMHDQEKGPRGLAEELTAWWVDLAKEEAAKVVPKAVEYGASDLAVMGEAWRGFIPEGSPFHTLTANEQVGFLQEMAIAFYLQGKVARLFGAFEQGKLPSDDTIHDINVYGRMLQRVRETGEWV